MYIGQQYLKYATVSAWIYSWALLAVSVLGVFFGTVSESREESVVYRLPADFKSTNARHADRQKGGKNLRRNVDPRTHNLKVYGSSSLVWSK